MKRFLLLVSLSFLAPILAYGQGGASLPNISYAAVLSSTCASTNGACAGGVVAGTGGVPGLPQANTGSLGSGPTLDVPVVNYNAATVTVQGTYAGSTINFEFSDSTGGVFYFQEVCARTDINLLEVSEALPSNSTRAWQCPVWGGYRFRVRQSALGSGSVNVTITLTQAAIDPSLVVAASITNIAGASDPCQDVSAIKSSVPISGVGVGTAQLIGLSGTTVIYVCSFQAVAGAGTNPSFQLQYGTGTNCATGITALTGAMSTGVTVSTTAPGPIFESSPGNNILKTPAGNALCTTVAGTSAVFNGWLSYVQQ